MATELPLRIILVSPPADVDYGVQHGKGNDYTMILTQRSRGTDLAFEFALIDLQDGRDGTAVEAWLTAHPGVEVVTRDRWTAYATAATAGAPTATQVPTGSTW